MGNRPQSLVVLVSCVSTFTGLNLANFLASTGIEVVGTDSSEVKFSRGTFLRSPHALEEKRYSEFLRETVMKFNIRRVFLCSDLELHAVGKYWQDQWLSSVGLPPANSIKLFQDKKLASQVAQEYGFHAIPEISLCDSEESLIYVKNRFSFERPKIGYILEDVPTNIKNNLMYLKYIAGEEFTIDTFLDNSGELTLIKIRKRLEVIQGVARKAEFRIIPNLHKNVQSLISRYQLRGFSSIQFIENAEGRYFLEVNTRPGGGLKHSLEDGMFSQLTNCELNLVF